MIMFFPSVFLSLKLSVISFSGNKPKNLLKKLDSYVIYLVGYKAPLKVLDNIIVLPMQITIIPKL